MLLDQVAAMLRSGGELQVEALLSRHPQHRGLLEQLLPTLRAIVRMSDAEPTGPELGGVAPLPELVDPQQQLGDFRLKREIGRGGMGVVYEAEQISIARTVAVKVLPFAALAGEKTLRRFQNEVRAAALLDHPHIVAVYSVGEERGIHYYAMKLVRGRSLADVIQQMRDANGRGTSPNENEDNLPLEGIGGESTLRFQAGATVRSSASLKHYQEVARIGIEAAEALQHAHEQGVVHRDIKPANLLLDVACNVMVTDFGLATIENDVHLTRTGELVGTLRYMSPEQALGKREEQDHRTDIYSLAATLYELLTLEPVVAWEGPRVILKQIARGEVRSPRELDPGIPKDLATILLKGLEQSPLDRYATVQELASDLRCFLEHQPIKAKPASTIHRVAKWSRRHVGVVWTATAAAILLACVSGTGAGLLAASRQEAYKQREIADAAAESAKSKAAVTQAVQDFINVDLLGNKDLQAGSEGMLLCVAVDRAADSVGTRFAGQPLVEAGIRETLGQTYLGLGQLPEAIDQLRRCRALRLAELGELDEATGAATQKLASALIASNRQAEAALLLATLYDQQLLELGPEHPATLQSMYAVGMAASADGRSQQAVKLVGHVVAAYKKRYGETASETLQAQQGMATVLMAAGQVDDAIAVARFVQDVSIDRHGPHHPESVEATILLSQLLTSTDREGASEAKAMLLEILPLARRFHGESHSLVDAIKRLAIEASAKQGDEVAARELRQAFPLRVHCFLAAAGAWHQAATEHEYFVKRYHAPADGLGWSEEWMRPAAPYVMAIREQGLSAEPFKRYCHAMIEHFASTEFAGDAERTLKTCLIYDLEIPLDRIRIDLIWHVLEENEAGYWERPLYQLALALYSYRIDDLVMTEALLEQCKADIAKLDVGLPDCKIALALTLESLLHSRLGHPAQARHALDEAERSLIPIVTFDAEGRVATGGVSDQRVAIDSLMIVALMDEARTKVADLEASGDATTLAPQRSGRNSNSPASK